ncbi:hypothetical protein EVAR_53466_1 [Eumeta japonica]|uniref:Uncharacterized protein n=1 Tax=Eumeta variegata TaxID=151549 RepID=A0A4C1XNZ9_EUMVA|nr:hypothetical protein EVAR_53466_1 [Eumeta japonica]
MYNVVMVHWSTALPRNQKRDIGGDAGADQRPLHSHAPEGLQEGIHQRGELRQAHAAPALLFPNLEHELANDH